jgi:hypothetical protein
VTGAIHFTVEGGSPFAHSRSGLGCSHRTLFH